MTKGQLHKVSSSCESKIVAKYSITLKKNCFVDSITAEINDKVSLKYIHFCHLRDFCNLSWCLLQIPSFVAPETTVKSPERSLKLHRFGATRQQGLEKLALIYLCLKDSWSCAFLSSVVSYQHLWCTFFSFCVHWILLLPLFLFHCFLFMVWFVSSTWSLSELVINGCHCWYSNSEKTSRCSNITYNVGFMKSGHLTTCVFCMFICLCCVFPAINDIIWGIQTTDTHIKCVSLLSFCPDDRQRTLSVT